MGIRGILSRKSDTSAPCRRATLPVLAAILAGAPAVYSQQGSPRQTEKTDKAAQTELLKKPEPPHLPDIVSDNLDHVSATAEQILQIVDRDPGMMVELKRLFAEDAGSSGQILEESDLTDVAISDRLRQDLHTRVMATHLLQRYGYLLPKLNPDSELAAEHNLEMRARTQELERTAEPHSASPPAPQTVITVGASPSSELLQNRGRATRQPISDESGTVNIVSPEVLHAPESRLSLVKAESTGSATATLPAAVSAPLSSDAVTVGANDMPPSSVPHSPRTVPPPVAETEPVRLERRPNPYADLPSLYDLYVQASARPQEVERFGLGVFRSGAADPEALPMDLPVGPDYIVGPGDSLSVNLWGGISQRLLRTVDREGRLALPEAGALLVSGKSLGEVQDSVQRVLRTQFRDVSADVSLLRLRTVRVYVVGEVSSPGAYDLSSLSTPLNALFAAGGVAASGSLRHLQHYRGNQLVEEVDGYDLLLHGIRGNLQRLENGDSLRVPPVGPSVTIEGMVRRPGLYELRGEKNLSEVLELAGGVLPAAALRHIEVQRLEAHEKRSMLSLEIGEGSNKDELRSSFEKFTIQDGDEIHIFPIAPYNTQAVYLEGHVLRPGRYSFHEGMKLSDLIGSHSDLLPEPSERYAEIIRIEPPDQRPVVESFSLAAALEHPESAPKLQPLDTVRIFGRYDLEPAPEFAVYGEVRNPGRYRSSGQAHLRDAIYQAGGLTPEAWQDSGQLFRILPDGATKVLSISLREALEGDPLNNVLIEPRDRILVHRQPSHVNPASVYVRGEVARPGRYPLTADMKVSDLVRSAGGLLRSANPENDDLTHYAVANSLTTGNTPGDSQAVKLNAALSGDLQEDATLRDGDVLTVPQRAGWKNLGASVTIGGEVAKPGVYGVQPGERLSSLLQRAGGLLPTAYPQAAVFERVEVRKMQEQSRQELIQRLEQESVTVKTTVTTSGSEEAALQQAAVQQRQRILDALRRAPVSGRLVVHVRESKKDFAASPDDIELRAGDTLEIPKQPGFVVIVGQVYNSNAISYSPGKNAGWYLSRAGGATAFANKKAIFIVRANGSVTSGGSGLWSGGVLTSAIGPGDTIIVPEKVVVGGSAWKNIVSIAQIAQAAALAAAVAIP
ncbi:MAG TPA: SLBB domain-containing protein [Candidatus Acidoferrum sp.]|nr:SLBB domain-containing protein [Candidatus Acidoferrum sp.]